MIFFKGFAGPIKALSFDLDDTLYDNVPVISRAERIFSRYLYEKYALKEEASESAFWSSVRRDLLKAEPRYESDMTLWRTHSIMQGLKNAGIEISEADAYQEALYFIKMRSEITVPETSFALLRDLRAHYPIAALSNGNSDLKQDGLESFFDIDLRASFNGPRCKPNPDLFLLAARELGVKPCEMLHIGDDPVTDIKGAVCAGFNAAWLVKGIAGKNAGFEALRALPHVCLNDLEELRNLLL